MRPQWQFFQNGITSAQIQNIKDIAEHYSFEDGKIFAESIDAAHSIRSSNVKWLTNHAPIQEMLWGFVRQANRNAFNVDVENVCEIQFTEYKAENEGFYNWHHDINWDDSAAFDRKLSVSVLLSDVSEFDGGEFMFKEAPNGFEFRAGSVIVFPSYLVHSVARVTRGTRQSLVAWFEGPRWR
jgi:PKHD-type hydroxylase